MMADGPTTGGYAKIAVVTTADLPLVAQCAPGRGELRFRMTSVREAQDRLRASRERLNLALAAGPPAQEEW
jgi:allophanate hydrolase subunit 2